MLDTLRHWIVPPCSQAVVAALARADALPEALPMLDAWLQQQEEALQDDENTHAPLQARRAHYPLMGLLADRMAARQQPAWGARCGTPAPTP